MKGVALDTNLLVLLLVGRAAPGLISIHKRLRAFDAEDFSLLVRVLGAANHLVIIPQCVAEVSNLAVQGVDDPLRSEILLGLKGLVGSAIERDIASGFAVAQEEYMRLGVTDAAWLAALDQNAKLVTADVELYLAALRRGHDAVRFSELRM